jgi:hypothetical protein
LEVRLDFVKGFHRFVKAGTSNTILVGEKAMDRRAFDTGGWYWNEAVFSGGSGGTDRLGTVILGDGINSQFDPNWESSHAGAALFVFGDGGVRPLRFGLDGGIVHALLTLAGGEIADPDK